MVTREAVLIMSSSPTLPGLIAAHLRPPAKTPALIYHERSITYAALALESQRLARGLRTCGVKAGDRVVTQGAYGVSDSSKVTTGKAEK